MSNGGIDYLDYGLHVLWTAISLQQRGARVDGSGAFKVNERHRSSPSPSTFHFSDFYNGDVGE
eukprot:scaffold73360_cov61-Cyclotella_meneghiniana.AAC.4